MLCTQTVTLREPDHHGGRDHGGGNKRNPVLGVMLLVACIYPFRCVVRTSVHSLKRTLFIPFYVPSRLPPLTAPYSFGHYSVSFARYYYPRIPQTSPRYALQRYNKRYGPGYDLDTLGYGEKSTIATIQKRTVVLSWCIIKNTILAALGSNFSARTSSRDSGSSSAKR